jgi:hypothetical protein
VRRCCHIQKLIGNVQMKRDMDLIRDILLKIEAGQEVFAPISSTVACAMGYSNETPLSKEEAEKLRGHLDLLEQEGLIEIRSADERWFVLYQSPYVESS